MTPPTQIREDVDDDEFVFGLIYVVGFLILESRRFRFRISSFFVSSWNLKERDLEFLDSGDCTKKTRKLRLNLLCDAGFVERLFR